MGAIYLNESNESTEPKPPTKAELEGPDVGMHFRFENGEVVLSVEALTAAERVVQSVFAAIGVVPRLYGTKLELDIPFWPGEYQRSCREFYARCRSSAMRQFRRVRKRPAWRVL